MSYQKNSITIYDADSLYKSCKKEVKVHDVLDRLVDTLVSLAEFAEYASSMPEIIVTVPTQLWVQFEEAQAYGYLQATAEGKIPNSEFRYLSFQLVNARARLIVQEGPATSALEVLQ